MSSFFSSSANSDVASRKEQMKSQIQQELAIANAQQLVNKINENCFAKCITKPGPSLSGSQESCLSHCMSLYMAAFDQVSRSYVARISKERGGAPGL
ncbi:mitochondrial import inner membrane translocase subunit TIM13 [Cryptococcus depauperatus CBS 7841]|uniref:Mitochondrial import inner membrane translocase subunit n=1 Tax=Cryptococcus depauperatus CBS 7841 TaxID=1295531 RepID=A0A1E3HV84_9TREE|nr:mitochondrial import inner membrane translocase subunit TIM13 [Cryptococcus depauperatus CBS 7841]ODN92330.1 mitochondrial import inner membrane translocase subunit TIM13 [Cryptococcus depauperatus CBS 7855]